MLIIIFFIFIFCTSEELAEMLREEFRLKVEQEVNMNEFRILIPVVLIIFLLSYLL